MRQYQEERGKRPVLFLSFKDIKGTTWAEALEQIRTLLASTIAQHFIEHRFCSESSSLPDQRIFKECVYTKKLVLADCSRYTCYFNRAT